MNKLVAMPQPYGLQVPSSTSLWEGTHLARQKKGNIDSEKNHSHTDRPLRITHLRPEIARLRARFVPIGYYLVVMVMMMVVDVELWSYLRFFILMSQLTACHHTRGRMHTILYHGQIVQTSLSNKR